MEELIVGFDYTIWANKQWVESLDKFPDKSKAEEVLQHMAFWQRNWLRRASLAIEQKDIDMLEDVSIGESLERGSRDWQNFLYRHADQDFSFELEKGGKYSMPLHRVARQLIYHSIYHRGHLRGLLDAAGIEDFPDTDWFYYSVDQNRWE